jgi:hypothetical protein
MRRALIGRIAPVVVLSLVALVAPQAAAAGGPAAPGGKGGGGSAKAACLAAHEDAQSLRTQKKPHAAREKLIACARVECPTVVRKECGEQLALVEKDAPTVALEARDESGMDTTAVKVSMDGNPFAERLTGAAVDVEPGEHLFRFERGDGKSIEQRVLVVEGEKNRKVVADFATLVPKPAGGAVGDGQPVVPRERKSIPVLSFVAAGVGVVALGSFTFFALSGKSAEKDLASSCGPSCSDAQLSPVKRDYLVADISLVVGIVAVATAVVLAWPALSQSSQSAPSATASVARRAAPPPWMPRVKVRALP